MKQDFKNKKIIIFDLDGTLTKSKLPADREMVRLLLRLLAEKRVAVIGGGRYELFKRQFLAKLPRHAVQLKNLFLFPTNSTTFYRRSGNTWKRIYAHELSAREKEKIMHAFRAAFKKTDYVSPKKIYGSVLDDRGTQITFSAAGQKAPLAVKTKWEKTSDVRPALMRALKKLVPEFEIRSGGLTSIDVTRKGIDKAYGVRQIAKRMKTPVRQMLFVGDALYPGGNDAAARKTGIRCVQIRGPAETKRLIKRVLART